MKPQDFYEGTILSRIDPAVLSDFDPDDDSKVEKELRDSKQKMEQEYRKHDERINNLLKMTGISARQIKKCESFIKRHNKIISVYAWNWRSQENKLKKKWRYRSILVCFSEPYCENLEARRLAESSISFYTQRLEELKRSVELGEEEKRRFIRKYYTEKWASLAIWDD